MGCRAVSRIFLLGGDESKGKCTILAHPYPQLFQKLFLTRKMIFNIFPPSQNLKDIPTKCTFSSSLHGVVALLGFG
jgi:hypothetical protein